MQLRQACWGRGLGARRRGVRGWEPPSTRPGECWPDAGNDCGNWEARGTGHLTPRVMSAPALECSRDPSAHTFIVLGSALHALRETPRILDSIIVNFVVCNNANVVM